MENEVTLLYTDEIIGISETSIASAWIIEAKLRISWKLNFVKQWNWLKVKNGFKSN